MFTSKELFAQARAKAEEALKAATPEDMARLSAEADALRKQAEAAKSAEATIAAVNAPVQTAPLPVGGTAAAPAEDAAKSVPYIVIPQDLNDPAAKAYRDIYGGHPSEVMYDIRRDFLGYVRNGILTPRLLHPTWDPATVKSLLEWGLSIAEIKTTMVEGQDNLGGAWVAPDIAAEILRQSAGLTAVLAGGATILDTVSNMVTWYKVTGGDTGATARYTSGLRGTWVGETASPGAQNFTTGDIMIPVHNYLYKVTLATGLLESVRNILAVFTDEVARTKAIDDDNEFLIGDGAKGPRGILPSSANADGLAEVVTGHATEMRINGLRHLRRGVAAPYRGARASFICESATGQAIEDLWDNSARHYVDTTLENGEFNKYLGGVYRESEAMPSIGAGNYVGIYGDLSGYAIVRRGGLIVVRYQDSNTGPNTVQFHVWARLGGRVIRPERLCVHKVSA